MGISLRAVARELDFSPSFVSQIENGKSQPSVATLYDLAQLLEVPIDELFKAKATGDAASTAQVPAVPAGVGGNEGQQRIPDRAQFQPQVSAIDAAQRLSVHRAGEGRRIELETGVVWTQLADNTSDALDFIEVLYPVGASSTTDNRMLRHVGYEYGYLIEGQLEVTVGFDVFVLRAGESFGLDSSTPHLFKNTGDVPARGIWCVHHTHPADGDR